MVDLAERLAAALARTAARRRSGDPGALIAAALTAAWLLLVVLVWVTGSGSGAPLARLSAALSVLLPPVLIWMALALSRAIADLRDEATSLRLRLDSVRRGAGDGDAVLLASGNTPASKLPPPSQNEGQAADPEFRGPHSRTGHDARPAPPGTAARDGRAAARPLPRTGTPRAGDADGQSSLPLGTPEDISVSPEELVAALNFPDGPEDVTAIRALRAALADPQAARLIRAAQDVITLMARHGLYMDDLDVAAAPPEVWRQLGAGVRGAALAPLAAVRDEAALEAAAGLMRSDELFRDAAHHFLRQFDRAVAREDARMNDHGLAALAATRSGRAFVLLAQVTGMFGSGPA